MTKGTYLQLERWNSCFSTTRRKCLGPKEAVEKMLTLPATTPNVSEILSSTLAKEKGTNRHCLLKVLSSLRFLARQGCGIRGHDDDKEGNCQQLFLLLAEDDPKVFMLHAALQPACILELMQYNTVLCAHGHPPVVSRVAEEEDRALHKP